MANTKHHQLTVNLPCVAVDFPQLCISNKCEPPRPYLMRMFSFSNHLYNCTIHFRLTFSIINDNRKNNNQYIGSNNFYNIPAMVIFIPWSR